MNQLSLNFSGYDQPNQHGVYEDCERLAIARLAACVMDDLITKDRHGIADQAARWSLEQMRSLRTTGKSARISF